MQIVITAKPSEVKGYVCAMNASWKEYGERPQNITLLLDQSQMNGSSLHAGGQVEGARDSGAEEGVR